MHAFLYYIDDSIWTSVQAGQVVLDMPKVEWGKAIEDKFNANNKALNTIFCGVSPEKFHKISHVDTTKEAWDILQTTYEGTKNVKDSKLEMLTNRFKELKVGENESFYSFHSKLYEIVTSKLNF